MTKQKGFMKILKVMSLISTNIIQVAKGFVIFPCTRVGPMAKGECHRHIENRENGGGDIITLILL
jgi:hypothetical protein